MLYERLNLQLFGEGGDGAAAGEGAGDTSGESNDVAMDARIPERARKAYAEAVKKNQPKQQPTQTPTETVEPEKPTHISYNELIKSDEYKEEHKAYMDKTIGERLKKYKGIEESNKSMRDALNIVGNKYNLDPNSETFMQDLTAKLNEDTSYYENYAMEHNISVDDAKEILTLKQNARAAEIQKESAEREAIQQQEWQRVVDNAELTKQKYPEFVLEKELQNPMFARACAAMQGDTTAAYWAVHHNELERAQGLRVSQQAAQQIANTVASNQSRPLENGLTSQALVSQTSWSNASLADIRKYAAEQRRKLGK